MKNNFFNFECKIGHQLMLIEVTCKEESSNFNGSASSAYAHVNPQADL